MELTPRARENLRALVARQPAVFGIESEPLLGGLLACLGILGELNTRLDRLAEFLGADGRKLVGEVIREDGEYGLGVAFADGGELRPISRELLPFFAPSSVAADGTLRRMAIFPERIARFYRARGIELVIVRDWILSTCLAEAPELAVDYNHANAWELVNNIGFQQAELMVLKGLPFFGTHDIVDHLAGASAAGLDLSGPLVERVYRKMQSVFYCGNGSAPDLLISYFFGILLDDFAQPRWYGCARHGWLAERMLALWDERPLPGPLALEELPTVPSYWSAWIESLRAGRPTFREEQESYLARFRSEVGLAIAGASAQNRGA